MRQFYRVMGLVLMLALVLGGISGCAPQQTPSAEPKKERIPIVLQISSVQAKEQVERRMNEVTKRGFGATVNASPEVVGCDYLKELSDKGFDIMGSVVTFGFGEEGANYEEQLAKTKEQKQAIEACIGKPVAGFTGGRQFRHDQYTWQILDEIGARYFQNSTRYEKLPCYALEPYKMEGHDFIIAPMQSRCVWNVGVSELDQTCLAMSGSI